jgi:hypothetical protein
MKRKKQIDQKVISNEKNNDELLRALRRAELLSLLLFCSFFALIILIVFILSTIIKDAKYQSIFISLGVSLVASLTYTIFFNLVVENAKEKSEDRALVLEMHEIQDTVSEVVLNTTNDLKNKIENRINKILEEETARLVSNWPDLLPADYFPPSDKSDSRYVEKLGSATQKTHLYIFRGGTSRFVPGLLSQYGIPGLRCNILIIDPRDLYAIRVYASDRISLRGATKTLEEYEVEVQKEIYSAITRLFDLRQRFRIEIRTCTDHLFYRTEIFDDEAFVSFYVGERQERFPQAHLYTKTKGKFYYEAFLKDFYQCWEAATESFYMDPSFSDDALERFLVKLKGGEIDSIKESISLWRKEKVVY